jgi:hypothetical protein
MNVFQPVPRQDCKVFAKCGVKSLSHSRRYCENDIERKGCALTHRKFRCHKFDTGDREIKLCIYYGRL